MAKKEKAPTEVSQESQVEPALNNGAMAEVFAETAKQKRDFFAISVASGILAHHGLGVDADHLAKSAYAYADALIASSNI